jgi:hypothetical protein
LTTDTVVPGVDGSPDRFDVLRYPTDHRVVPAGTGDEVVTAHREEARKRQLLATLTVGLVALGLVGAGAATLLDGRLVPAAGGVAAGVFAAAARYRSDDHEERVPAVVVADVPERVVRQHVDGFDPTTVSDPFGRDAPT